MFDTDQAADLAKAGADVLVPHMGTIGAQTTITLQDAALSVQGMHDAVKKVNPDSSPADTYFSTAIRIRRYRIKCPCADRSMGPREPGCRGVDRFLPVGLEPGWPQE